MRQRQDEAEARVCSGGEAAARIAEAKRLGDEKEALRLAALKEEEDRIEAERLAIEEEQLRMKRAALAEAPRAPREEEPSVSLRDSISLTDSSSSDCLRSRTRRATPRTARRHLHKQGRPVRVDAGEGRREPQAHEEPQNC